MDINAMLDGFMVHPLDLFPTNKNLMNNNLSKISTNTANLDGFIVHPIDMFVSNEDRNKNFNLAQNLTQNYQIINTKENNNNINSIYPYGLPNNEINIFNQYPTIKNIQIYQTQIQQPNPFPNNQTIYNLNSTTKRSNVGQIQNYNNYFPNSGITYNTIQTITSTQNPAVPKKSIQNINNYNLFSTIPIFDNQNNIIQLPSITIQNVTDVKTIYDNYNQPQPQTQSQNKININSIINSINPNYNIYSTTNQISQNYPLFNNENFIAPKNQMALVNSVANYYPNKISNITNINYQQAPIEANQINNRFPMDSAPKNNNINIISNANNNIPYNTESYEPYAANYDFPSNKISFNNIKTYFNSPTISPIPTNTRVYSVPKTIKKMKNTIILPSKKSIILPPKKTVIMPKKTTVISPKIQRSIIPINTVSTTPIHQSIIRNYRPVLNNNLNQTRNNFIPITKSIIPLNNYSSHTINVLPTPLSHINNYNQRTIIPNNTSIIAPLKNQRSISNSTFTSFSPLQNTLKLRPSKIVSSPFGRIVYKPRNFK